MTEHTHIPASRRTPWPGGGPLPKEYSHTLDPFVGLTMAAAVTSRLRLGTGICLVIEHDPIVAAKAVASLDLLRSGMTRKRANQSRRHDTLERVEWPRSRNQEPLVTT